MKEISQLSLIAAQKEDEKTINNAIEIINTNFTLLADTLEQHRLCLVSMNDVIEPTSEFLQVVKKEIEELKDEAKADLDAIGHHHVRLTAIEESSKVTVHEVQQLKEEQQTHFDALVQQKAAIDALQNQIDTLTANLLDTVKSLTVFVKSVEMRLQLIEKPPCIMP
jgi:DNA repair ATPase RecN